MAGYVPRIDLLARLRCNWWQMADEKGQSSLVMYYVGKVVSALIALAMLVLTGLLAGGGLEFITHPESRYLLMALGPLASILALVVCWRLARVTYDRDGVTVLRNGEERRYAWSEVDRVFQVVGLSPPTYQMSFRSSGPPIYFCLKSWEFVSVIVWSWDFTDFVPWARQRIREARQTDGVR